MLPLTSVFVFALTVVAVINFCRWMCQNEAHSRPERYSMTPSPKELLFRKIDGDAGRHTSASSSAVRAARELLRKKIDEHAAARAARANQAH